MPFRHSRNNNCSARRAFCRHSRASSSDSKPWCTAFLPTSFTWFASCRKTLIDAGQLQVVIHLVQQVAQRRRIAVAVRTCRAKPRRQLLLDRLLKHRTAHHGASRKQPKKIAASRLVQISVRFFRAGRTPQHTPANASPAAPPAPPAPATPAQIAARSRSFC